MLTNFNPYSVQFPMFQGPTPMQTPVPSQTYIFSCGERNENYKTGCECKRNIHHV